MTQVQAILRWPRPVLFAGIVVLLLLTFSSSRFSASKPFTAAHLHGSEAQEGGHDGKQGPVEKRIRDVFNSTLGVCITKVYKAK